MCVGAFWGTTLRLWFCLANNFHVSEAENSNSREGQKKSRLSFKTSPFQLQPFRMHTNLFNSSTVHHSTHDQMLFYWKAPLKHTVYVGIYKFDIQSNWDSLQIRKIGSVFLKDLPSRMEWCCQACQHNSCPPGGKLSLHISQSHSTFESHLHVSEVSPHVRAAICPYKHLLEEWLLV